MNYAETMFPLPDGWDCADSGEFFCEIFPTARDIPAHGWKLRINAPCLKSFPSVLRVASKLFFTHRIAFKCARSPDALRQLHAKNIGIGIAGKAITGYIPDASVLIDLVDKLTQSLSALSLPPASAPWSDKRIIDKRIGESCLSYRYGSYLPKSTIRTASGEFVDRRDIFQLPPGISDPFDDNNNSGPAEVPEAVRLNDDFLIESVLTRNWGGSVYSGRSLRTNEAHIIKEARSDALIACEVLSTDLLTHEHSVLKAIENFQIAPVPVDFFEIDRHLFLVLPKLGVNLLKWRRYHGSEPERCKAIARKIASQLSFLHNKTATSHGDISSANTIISDDGSVRLIDFEMARQNATKADLAEDTKQFVTVLRTLLLLNKYNCETLWLAEQGAPIEHILDRLNP